MRRLPEVIRERRLRFDWPMFLVTVALAVIGLATLLSATISPFSDSMPSTFKRQALFMGIGLVGMLGLAAIDPRFYERIAYVVFGATALLVLRIVLGWLRLVPRSWRVAPEPAPDVEIPEQRFAPSKDDT